mgnify:CR=1 FL=1
MIDRFIEFRLGKTADNTHEMNKSEGGGLGSTTKDTTFISSNKQVNVKTHLTS